MNKINKLEAVHSFTVMPRDCNFNRDENLVGDMANIKMCVDMLKDFPCTGIIIYIL